MSLDQGAARDRKTPNAAVSEPPYTIDEFCAAERMSRSMLKPGHKGGALISTGSA